MKNFPTSEEETWETEFIEKNKRTLIKFLRLFHPNSRKGLFLIILLLHCIVLLFTKISMHINNVITAFLYLSFLFILLVIIYNLPEKLFNFLFPPTDDQILEGVSKKVLISQLRLFRLVFNVLANLHQSLFVRCDVLTISGFFTIIFGILLFLHSFPLCILFHSLIVFLLIALAYMGSVLCNSKPDI